MELVRKATRVRVVVVVVVKDLVETRRWTRWEDER